MSLQLQIKHGGRNKTQGMDIHKLPYKLPGSQGGFWGQNGLMLYSINVLLHSLFGDIILKHNEREQLWKHDE